MKSKLKKALFLFCFILVGCLSLLPGKDKFGEIDIPKKYLLDGTLISDDSSFSYYLIAGSENEVAIGKGENESSYSTLTIPEKVTLDGTEYTVTGIWHRGFAHCSVSSLSLPNSLKIIDYEAFYGNDIVSLNIPYSVEKRGSGAFALNKKLKNLAFNESENSVPSGDREACPVEDSTEEETSAQSDETSVTGSKLNEIPDYCFDRCESLNYLTFPSSLKSICYGAFQRCSGLTSLYFPTGLTLVEGKAFNFCKSLAYVYIPTSLTSLNEDNTLKGRIDPFAFTFCNGNRVFQFAAGKDVISSWENINGIDWEYKTDRMENDDRYSKTTRVYDLGDIFVSGVWQYKDYSCDGESGIQLVRYLGDRTELKDRKVYDQTNRRTYQRYAVGMPDSIGGKKVISIDASCLDNLRSNSNPLTDLFLPDTLLEIPSGFLYDTSSKSIKFPQLFIVDVAKNNCFAPDQADYSFKSVKGYFHLSGRKNLHSIGDYAFHTTSGQYLIKQITEITLPPQLKYIGKQAFEGHDHVSKFTLENDPSYEEGLEIQWGAFGWVGNQGSGFSVTLPSRTTHVYDNAFQSTKIRTFSILNAEKDKEVYGTRPTKKYKLELGSNILNYGSSPTTPYVYIYDRGSESVGTGTNYFTVTINTSTFSSSNIDEFGQYNQGCLEVFLPSSVIVSNNGYKSPLFPKNGRVTLYFSDKIKTDFGGDFDLISKDVSGKSKENYNFGTSDDSLRTYYDRRIPVYENVDISQRDTDALNISSDGKKILKHKNDISYLLNPSTHTAKVTRYLGFWLSNNTTATATVEKELTYGDEVFTVDEIGDNAFSCSDLGKDSRTLSKVILPDTIKKIGKYAFFKCPGLTEITVKKGGTDPAKRPSSLESIGSFAFSFSGVKELNQINDDCGIADSENLASPSPFYNCPNLSAITLKTSGNTPKLSLGNNGCSLKADNTVVWVSSSFAGADTSFSFNAKFHYGVLGCANWITSLTLNPSYFPTDSNGNILPQALFNGYDTNGIRTKFKFGNYASGSSSSTLNSVTIQKDEYSGLSIPNGAFKNCGSLKEIMIPNVQGATKNKVLPASLFADAKNVNVFKVEGDSNSGQEGILDLRNTEYESIESSAFQNRTGITQILLPDSRISIGSNSFNGCTGLSSLTCGSGLKTIGDYAFNGCSKLQSLHLDDALRTIGSHAFNGCTGLKELKLNEGLETIGGSAFEKCTSITSVTIPSTVNSIGSRAFCSGNSNSGSLKELIFEDGCKLTSIPEKFVQYQPLTSLSLPSRIETIGKNAFSSTKIKALDLSRNNKRSSFRGFDNCTELTKVVLPTSIKTISDSALLGCTALEEINIEQLNSLNTIEQGAFSGAFNGSGNLSLAIPASLTGLGSYSFSSTGAGLKAILFKGKKFSRNANTFNGSKIERIIFQDSGTGTGSGFTNTSYAEGCFGNRPNLKTIVLPSTFDVTRNNKIFKGSNSDVIVCLNRTKSNSTSTFGSWVSIDGTHQVKYAYKDETAKQAGTYYWKWNTDKTDVAVELFASASSQARIGYLLLSLNKVLRLRSLW